MHVRIAGNYILGGNLSSYILAPCARQRGPLAFEDCRSTSRYKD